MIVIRALCYAYGGALLAGLAMAVLGLSTGMSTDTVATAAAPVGMVAGMTGMSLPFLRRAIKQRRARVRR